MKLLIVEDETPTAAYLQRGLSEEGFDVELARTVSEAESVVKASLPDAILLDVMLPGGSGFDLCRMWREQGITTPILFLTARDDISDRVQGLNLGGDDYLVKPFAFDELLARVRALLRRGTPTVKNKILHVADLKLNTILRQVTRGQHIIPLTAREYALLEYFAVNAGKLITRNELWERVWGGSSDPDSNVVDVYVRYLRNKLGRSPEIIETVRGSGYMLQTQHIRATPDSR